MSDNEQQDKPKKFKRTRKVFGAVTGFDLLSRSAHSMTDDFAEQANNIRKIFKTKSDEGNTPVSFEDAQKELGLSVIKSRYNDRRKVVLTMISIFILIIVMDVYFLYTSNILGLLCSVVGISITLSQAWVNSFWCWQIRNEHFHPMQKFAKQPHNWWPSKW